MKGFDIPLYCTPDTAAPAQERECSRIMPRLRSINDRLEALESQLDGLLSPFMEMPVPAAAAPDRPVEHNLYRSVVGAEMASIVEEYDRRISRLFDLLERVVF